MKHTTVLATAITALLLASCHQPQTIIATHRTDTIQLYTVQHDSIDRYHTHYIHQQGDTLHVIDTFYIDRYRTLYRDSIHIVHDSIPYPVEVVQTETDYRGWWWFGGLAVVCLLIIAIRIVRLFR